MADTVMHFSVERASVNILSGSRTEAMASKVEKSVSDGILYQFFFLLFYDPTYHFTG